MAHQPILEEEAHQEIPDAKNSEPVIPPTPIRVMQQIGAGLEIEEELLTKDKLEAAPSATTSSMDTDDI